MASTLIAELRKILENVEKGELTPEDGEKLIEALFDSNGFASSADEASDLNNEPLSGEFNEVVKIKSGDKVKRDISIFHGKLIVEGELIGNVSAVDSELVIAGTINGNLNVVRSKLIWNGGNVQGNCNAVMCKDVGTPNVSGRYNNIAINVPFFNDSLLKNNVIFKNSDEDIVVISEKYNDSDVRHERVLIKGEVKVKTVKCEELFVEGTLNVDVIKCERLENKDNAFIYAEKIISDGIVNKGFIHVGKINAEVLENYEKIIGEKIIAELFTNFGDIDVNELVAEEIENNGEIYAKYFEAESLQGNEIRNKK